MPTPFPGMDPYLERRGLWEEVHTGLIAGIQRSLNPLIRPRYRAAIERRVYLAERTPEEYTGKADALIVSTREATVTYEAAGPLEHRLVWPVELPMAEEVTERYLELREVETGEVVTIIEILSHSNKSTRQGREQYQRKRLAVLASLTNLVEIDLLRAGEPMPMSGLALDNRNDYRVIISRWPQRPQADGYLFSVRDPLPDLPIPLRPGEAEPILSLHDTLHDLYDRAGFDLVIDYSLPSAPPLRPADAEWAARLTSKAGTLE